MLYYTELIKRPIIDKDGRDVGILLDLIFKDGTEIAPITHLVYLAKDKYKKRLAWKCVKEIKQTGTEKNLAYTIILNCRYTELEPTFVHENDLLLNDLLDKQIIDVSGVKVVRVNDLRLNRVDDDFCITAVCVGMQSFLRRLGMFGELLQNLYISPVKEKLIPWKSVEPFETKKDLTIKESKTKIENMHPGDIADILEELSPKEQMFVFKQLDKKTAAKALVEAHPETQQSFFKGLKLARIVELLENMPEHRAADVLAVVTEEKASQILAAMKPEIAEKIKALQQYPHDTAGALMRTDFFILLDAMTAKKALDKIRKEKPSADKIHIILVVDKEEHLVGTVSMRSLLTIDPKKKIIDFMKKHPFVCHLWTPKEEIAIALEKYNYFILPVVDEAGKLKGMITSDEVLSEIMPQSWIRRKFIAKRAKKKQKQKGAVNGI